MSANFSDLQVISQQNLSEQDQIMLRLDNAVPGPDGFGRIQVQSLRYALTQSLTAADSKVKQASAQWDEAYDTVNNNQGLFTLVVDSSANWNTAYNAISAEDYNLQSKEFNYIIVNGPYDAAKLANNQPVLLVTRSADTPQNLLEAMPVNTSALFKITSAGNVGINVTRSQEIVDSLLVNGSVRIDGLQDQTALYITGNLTVNGALTALSGTTLLQSNTINTSAFTVSSNGAGPAFVVNQYDSLGNQPIARFQNVNSFITFESDASLSGIGNIFSSGYIIAGTNNNKSTFNNVYILGSNITANADNYTYVNNLSSQGIVADASGNSNNWNSVYTSTASTSSNWNSVYTSTASTSSNWNSVYTSTASTSSNWDSVYSTTSANSAFWNSGGGIATVFSAIAANTSAATPTCSLTAVSVSASADAALVAKGTGATLAQIPNNAASGGSARGQYATDWQKARATAASVASGNYSVIGGGYGNRATATYTTIAGGISNTVTAGWSTVAGGNSNNISALYSAIGGGTSNSVTENYGCIAGGFNNIASGELSVIAGGASNNTLNVYAAINGGLANVASGYASFVLGGESNAATNNYTCAFGYGASATNYGELAHSTGIFNAVGDNKSSKFLLRTTTNGATSAVCYLDGGSQEITMPANSTYAFTTTIVGLSSHENASGLHYTLRGMAKCNSAGNVTVYGVTTVGTNYRIPTTMNASMSASGNKLRIVVYTPTSALTYWHAKVEGEYLSFT